MWVSPTYCVFIKFLLPYLLQEATGCDQLGEDRRLHHLHCSAQQALDVGRAS